MIEVCAKASHSGVRAFNPLDGLPRHGLNVTIEGRKKERALVAERPVQASWIEPHRGAQVMNRRAVEAMLPESIHGMVQHCRFVELLRSSHQSQ